MFSLTITDVWRLPVEIAEKTKYHITVTKSTKRLGKWYYNLKAKTPQISLRQPESTSLARAKGWSPKEKGETLKLQIP